MNRKIVDNGKFALLVESLRQYNKVAVAFSGGIDSTLLLYAAKTALGKGNVIALTLLSSIIPSYATENFRNVFRKHFFGEVELREIYANPLQWRKFTDNDLERCYFCKKEMYTLLISAIKKDGCIFLLDGTNADDIKEYRPGLKAVQELDVHTPLLNADLNKLEIRNIARNIGLINCDLPSNSCLATRVPHGTKIDKELLDRIDRAESFLLGAGFPGCRVKPHGFFTIIEVQADHMRRIMMPEERNLISSCFSSLNLGTAALSFTER